MANNIISSIATGISRQLHHSPFSNLQLGAGGLPLPSFEHGRRSTLPGLHLTLSPVLGDEDDHLNGELLLDGPFNRNDTIVVLPTSIASTPTAQYPPESLTISDSNGALDIFSYDGVGPFGLPTRFWLATRPSNGTVKVQFTARPRVVDPSSQVGPLFDLRGNEGGILGSLWALVPSPPADNGVVYDISLLWNLTQESRAAWTWGDGPGPHTFTSTTDRLLLTYFSVGGFSSYPPASQLAETDSDFGMYWFDTPPFEIESLAAYIQRFFTFSSTFWNDTSGEPYRVFIRRNDENGDGGTAMLRSFMFGWDDGSSTTATRLRTLLAHEMTHNWPQLVGNTSAESSRYSEGMAEYYSLRLLWRSGELTAAEYLTEMNRRVSDYYSNPTVNLSDEAAMEIAWQTRDAQRIPYGRGMIHFTHIDTRMREKWNSTKSLDNLAISFLDGCRGGSPLQQLGMV
jgi:hypothetical protein